MLNAAQALTVTFNAAADLSITKTDSPDPVATSGSLAYTIGGFLFMLFLLLPRTGRMSVDPVGSAPSPPLAGSSPAAP